MKILKNVNENSIKRKQKMQHRNDGSIMGNRLKNNVISTLKT